MDLLKTAMNDRLLVLDLAKTIPDEIFDNDGNILNANFLNAQRLGLIDKN